MDRRAASGRALTGGDPPTDAAAGRALELPVQDASGPDAPGPDAPGGDARDHRDARDRDARDRVAPDRDGLYGPASEAWRLNREALLLLGAGPRALLMQLAHPLVAEGVDQHSDFRRDPWARLAGTLRSYLGIVYGTSTGGRAEIHRLNELHRRVAGPVRDEVARAVSGRSSYVARDPTLSLWVHATLIDSTIVAYDAWLDPLPRSARERFYRETIPVGLAFGIPSADLPADLAAFEAYVSRMLGRDGPVRVTPTARSLARTILHPPLGPLAPPLAPLLDRVPPVLYDWTLWPALELLPPGLREQYGIPDDTFRRAVSAWLLAGWRAWRPLLPVTFRSMPQALAADRRVGGGVSPGVGRRAGAGPGR